MALWHFLKSPLPRNLGSRTMAKQSRLRLSWVNFSGEDEVLKTLRRARTSKLDATNRYYPLRVRLVELNIKRRRANECNESISDPSVRWPIRYRSSYIRVYKKRRRFYTLIRIFVWERNILYRTTRAQTGIDSRRTREYVTGRENGLFTRLFSPGDSARCRFTAIFPSWNTPRGRTTAT